MTLRELLNEVLSLTLADAGLIISGVLLIAVSLWEWVTTDPVDEERFSEFALLRERTRVAIYPLGYLLFGVAFLTLSTCRIGGS